MFARNELIIVELWKDDLMIAADFGHPTGNSVYFATRWYNRSYGKYCPGFAILLLSAKYFEGLGYRLFDLGGTDGSVMMSYKKHISFIFTRQEFMYHFLKLRDGSKSPTGCIDPGVVVDRASLNDMFGIGYLK